jgi:hypothetical protein
MWQKASSPTIAGGSSIMSNMLAEGVEEVSEEALYDVTRVTFNLINSFRGGKPKLKNNRFSNTKNWWRSII